MKAMIWRERISIIAATQVMGYLEVVKVEEDLMETTFIVVVMNII